MYIVYKNTYIGGTYYNFYTNRMYKPPNWRQLAWRTVKAPWHGIQCLQHGDLYALTSCPHSFYFSSYTE